MVATSVIFAISLFRHGDRTFITKEGWKDDHDPLLTNFIITNEGYGQLTPCGRKMHERVGKHMRRRYLHLLQSNLRDSRAHHSVHVRSTQYDRTLQSAQAQLSTLFRHGDVTVPVHTASRETEWLLRGCSASLCPAMAWDGSRNYRVYNGTRINVADLSDTIVVCRAHNCSDHLIWPRDLQDWVERENVDVLLDFMAFDRAKLGAAPLASQIVRMLKNVSRGDTGWSNDPTFFDDTWPLAERRLKDPNLILYSAHDTTIENMLGALKAFDGNIPPYASQLVFELYRHKKALCVRLWYNRGPDAPWKEQIRLCDKDCCSVADLEARLEESMVSSVSEYQKRCKLTRTIIG